MPVMKHIHLDLTLDAGGEKAPPTKWKATARSEVPVVFIKPMRTLQGKLRRHALMQSAILIQQTNFQYKVKVAADQGMTVQERKALLKSFNGEFVYLVDHEHCSDGQDHTPYVRRMLAQVGEFKSDPDKLLNVYYVDVMLEDASL